MNEKVTHVKYASTNKEDVEIFLSKSIGEKGFFACSPILPTIKSFNGKQKHGWKVEVKFKELSDV